MKIGAYLQNEKEEIPQWLKRFGKESRFRFGEAHGGRIVYYPAPWLNGHAIKTFNRAGYAHVFLLADRDCDEATVSAEMRKADGFDGALTMTVRVHICSPVTEDSLDADAESFVRVRPFGYRIYWQDQIVQSDEDGRVIGWKPCVSPPFPHPRPFSGNGDFFQSARKKCPEGWFCEFFCQKQLHFVKNSDIIQNEKVDVIHMNVFLVFSLVWLCRSGEMKRRTK